MTAYVQLRSSDVSDTRLPNAGASAAMPSASSSLSAVRPRTHTQRHSPHYVATPTHHPAQSHHHHHTHTRTHTPPMCNTITTNERLRTAQVQRCQRHRVTQRRRQCRHALCAKLVPCNRRQMIQPTQRYSPYYVSTPAYLHCTIPPRTRLPCVTRSQ